MNSCEKREVKSKGEKERNTHLNAEFQRIARRDKKASSDSHFAFLHFFFLGMVLIPVSCTMPPYLVLNNQPLWLQSSVLMFHLLLFYF